MEPDFLDEMVAKRAMANPQLPAMVEAARVKRAERRAALNAKPAAPVAGMPDPAEERLVDGTLKRRRG